MEGIPHKFGGISGLAELLKTDIELGLKNDPKDLKKRQKIFNKYNVSETQVTVIREGKPSQIMAKDLVPGDLIELHEKEIVPIYGILIEDQNLIMNEEALTGEKEPIRKEKYETNDKNCRISPLMEVISGIGRVLVLIVGDENAKGVVIELVSVIQ